MSGLLHLAPVDGPAPLMLFCPGIGKALLGSTSQEILLQADCDVLGVKLSLEEEDAD